MKSTTSAAGRAAMLEAAEFIDLLPYTKVRFHLDF
jgi:hypothetical protein